MTAYSLNYAKENLERIAQEAVDNDQATYITLDSGESVVIVPRQRYESWNETEYLLSNPANRRYLLNSIEQYRQGRVIRKSIEELENSPPQ